MRAFAKAGAPSAERHSVILIDDDAALLETLSATMELRYDLFSTTSPARALKHLESHDCHVVVSDWQMPTMDGVTLFREIRKLSEPVACLLMTGRMEQFSSEVTPSARKLVGLIAKPFQPEKLFERIDQMAALTFMKRSVMRLKRPL